MNCTWINQDIILVIHEFLQRYENYIMLGIYIYILAIGLMLLPLQFYSIPMESVVQRLPTRPEHRSNRLPGQYSSSPGVILGFMHPFSPSQFQLKPFKSNCLQPEATSFSWSWAFRSSFVEKHGSLYSGSRFSFSSLAPSGFLLVWSWKCSSSLLALNLPSGKLPLPIDNSPGPLSLPIDERNLLSFRSLRHLSSVCCSIGSSTISFGSNVGVPW